MHICVQVPMSIKGVFDPFELELKGPCHLPDVGVGMELWYSAVLRGEPFHQHHQLLFLNVYLYE